MSPLVRALTPLTDHEPCAPGTLRRVAVGSDVVDIIRLDSDTFIHLATVGVEQIGHGKSAQACLAMRVGDADPQFCIRRYLSIAKGTRETKLLDCFNDTAARTSAAREYQALHRVGKAFRGPAYSFPILGPQSWGTVDRLATDTLEPKYGSCRENVTSSDLAVLLLHVGRSLRSVHRAGFAHRDIKRLNILVHADGPQPELRLIDLDLSVDVFNCAKTGVFHHGIERLQSGMPPECLGALENPWLVHPVLYEAPAGVSPRLHAERLLKSDVYSLAYLVCRERVRFLPPTDAEHQVALRSAFEQARLGRPIACCAALNEEDIEMMRRSVAEIAAMPRGLGALLLQMLARNPDDRPDMEEVVRRVEASGLADRPADAIWFRAATRQAAWTENAARLAAAVGCLQRDRPEWLTAPPWQQDALQNNIARATALLEGALVGASVGAAVGAPVPKKKSSEVGAQRIAAALLATCAGIGALLALCRTGPCRRSGASDAAWDDWQHGFGMLADGSEGWFSPWCAGP